MHTPTTGEQISEYDNPAKALLVIDVQEDYTGLNRKLPPLFRNVDRQINTLNKIINKAAESGIVVIYVRQIVINNFLTRNIIRRTIDGLPGTEMDSRISVINNNDFTKKIGDSFSNPELNTFLIRNHVNKLYLAGLDAAYCVRFTAMGGINRGYSVYVLKDAVMTQKNLDDILEQYKKDGIGVITSTEFFK
ncbi:MAG: cysteine hydrolase [Spirochaetes bacterium]|nr:cysteine hydrolase [Spirochaetota bacterium]